MIKGKLSKWLEPERRIWPVFVVVFLVSQVINIWVAFPDYTGWNVFGFPLSYFQYHSEIGYTYFNMINLLIDMVIMFIVARILLFGYGQLTKYRIIK